MPRLRLLFLVLASLVALALTGAGAAAAAIVFDGTPGTGAPPATLGPYPVTPFGADPQPLFGTVSAVTAPAGGTLSFSPLVEHRRIGQGWNTWSHGYAGDVYWSRGALSTTLALPAGTSAFYLYAEPNPYAVFNITAVSQDGTTSGPIPVYGFAGASYFGFYGTDGDHIASITVSSGTDFAIGEFGIATKSKNYIALGDSYSSGEGDPPFFAGTDGGGDFCHRSPQAYSEVLGARYGAAPKFYACSGAVTSDITSTFHMGEPPQITRDGVDNTADLVTMTIGGNDAGFADTLKACISQKLKADAFNAAIGPVGRWLGFGKDPSCAHSSDFVSSAHTKIDNVFWPVKSTYLALKSATDPNNTSIMVADYPKLFPVSHDDQGCLSLSIILTHDDMDWMNTAGDRLDNLLAQAAGEAGVNFVEVRGTFAGHEICGPAGSYINGLSTASGSGGACTWEVLGHCIIPGLPVVGSFHPNPSGHSAGYAAAFAAAIGSAAAKNPAGFPVNPFPLPDPPSTTAVTPVGVGTLDAHAVTSGSDDCSDTYQAGQQVTVAGEGFVPGAVVQLYVTSPGVSSSGELQVGAVSADAQGHVSGTIRIPLTATGFVQPNAAAGLVFVDAIGLGTAANHLDDTAMVGLAPHTSGCGTVETLTFSGFGPPIANLPSVNKANAGRAIPVKFSVDGAVGSLDVLLAPGYPQSSPVTCSAPEDVTSGDPTASVGNPSGGDGDYHYNWKTDKSWHGCRTLIVKLVDGSYHRAVFDFGK